MALPPGRLVGCCPANVEKGLKARHGRCASRRSLTTLLLGSQLHSPSDFSRGLERPVRLDLIDDRPCLAEAELPLCLLERQIDKVLHVAGFLVSRLPRSGTSCLEYLAPAARRHGRPGPPGQAATNLSKPPAAGVGVHVPVGLFVHTRARAAPGECGRSEPRLQCHTGAALGARARAQHRWRSPPNCGGRRP